MDRAELPRRPRATHGEAEDRKSPSAARRQPSVTGGWTATVQGQHRRRPSASQSTSFVLFQMQSPAGRV